MRRRVRQPGGQDPGEIGGQGLQRGRPEPPEVAEPYVDLTQRLAVDRVEPPPANAPPPVMGPGRARTWPRGAGPPAGLPDGTIGRPFVPVRPAGRGRGVEVSAYACFALRP